MKHLVLVSGGMDSATVLCYVLQKHPGETLALSVRYGSLHQDAENKAAEDICRFLGVDRYVITMPPDLFSGGALMGEGEIPEEEYHDIELETPSVTVVPFRNAVLLSVAAAIAEGHGYDNVWFASHATDAQGFAYPDCTPEFVGAMTSAVYIGTHRKVRLKVPFQMLTKAGIVNAADELNAPLGLTWSCYRGSEKHCGACPTCKERKNAFMQAGFIDPVAYVTEGDWPAFCKRWPHV